MLASSSEVIGDLMVWGWSGTCSLQVERVVVLEQPTCSNLICWLAREAEADGAGAQGYALVPRAWRVGA